MGILRNLLKLLPGSEAEQKQTAMQTETVSAIHPVKTQNDGGQSPPDSQSSPKPVPTAQSDIMDVSTPEPQTGPVPWPASIIPFEPSNPYQPGNASFSSSTSPGNKKESDFADANTPFNNAKGQAHVICQPEKLISKSEGSTKKSTRMIPPAILSPTSDPSAVETSFFDEVVAAFDEAFDAAFRPDIKTGQQVVSSGSVQHDKASLQDLFANIAANYARPVKNFVFELKRGTATKEWVDICRPAIHSITSAAETMDLALATKCLIDFDAALLLAQTSEERVLGGEIRDLILASYLELVEVMPQTFVIGEEEQQREGIIINSLLKQIPDLGRVTLNKLYGAGLTTLDMFFSAREEDLAATAGIQLWLCERICSKFRQYRKELKDTPRDMAQTGHRSRLAELVSELHRHHEGYERATAEDWSDPRLTTEKRKFRQDRQDCILQINVVLAELGELDLINELQKVSFERRIQKLEAYLTSSAGVM